MIRRVVAEGLGLPLDRVIIQYVALRTFLDSGVGGSRVTVWLSEAAHLGVLEFDRPLLQEMAQALGIPVQQVEWRAGDVGADTASGRTLDLATLASRGVTVETLSDHWRRAGGAGERARGGGDQLLRADCSGWRRRRDGAGVSL